MIKRTVYRRTRCKYLFLFLLLIPSLVFAQGSDDLFSENNIMVSEGELYLELGKNYAREGYRHKALKFYENAISTFSGLDRGLSIEDISPEIILHPANMFEAFRLKAQIFLDLAEKENSLQNRERALKTYQKAAEFITELQRYYNLETAKYALRKHTADIYKKGFRTAYQLYRETGNDAFKRDAFLMAEKSRYRILLEKLRERHAINFANIPDSLIEKEYDLRSKITELQQQISKIEFNGESVDSVHLRKLKDSLSRAANLLGTHIKMLDDNYPRYHKLKYGDEELKPVEIQKRIVGRKHTILQYFIGTEAVYAFAISRKQFELYKLHPVSDLSPKIEKYRKALQDAVSLKKFTNISSQLYKILIEPVDSVLKTEKLIIIPDDQLSYIPFESLTKEGLLKPSNQTFRELPYLVRNYEINYAPSVSFLELVNRFKSRDNKNKYLGFAPKFDSISESQKRSIDGMGNTKLSSLPFSCNEVETIGRIVSKRRGIWSILSGYKPKVSVFLDTLATEKRFKSQPLAEYEIIHIATHAFATGGKNPRAGIFFADSDNDNEDGILRVREIYNLNMDANLLTLSACKTGIGYFAEGEGLTGLSRAFQYAGARNLLVSHWDVDDRATYRLMTEFYSFYHNKNDITSALQDAKINLLNTGTFAHPTYWASFILIGPQ